MVNTTQDFKKLKKDFQKAIKAIREEMGTGEYPKAMLTFQQAKKNTGTVNCGSANTQERANDILKNQKFIAFLEKYNIKAAIDNNGRDYAGRQVFQVRITYQSGVSLPRPI